MSHYQKDANTERGYSLQTKPASFLEQAKLASIEIVGDEATDLKKQTGKLQWDKKTHNFVRPTVGADNKKRIRTESGLSVAASFKTDRYLLLFIFLFFISHLLDSNDGRNRPRSNFREQGRRNCRILRSMFKPRSIDIRK